MDSKNILFYTGWGGNKWNYTYFLSNALGGSETAVLRLALNFPKNWKIYITGNMETETFENLIFVDETNLEKLLRETEFHTIIVSRYTHFYQFYPYYKAFQTFIWVHDITITLPPSEIKNENEKVMGYICQTHWHSEYIKSIYPSIANKIHIINNGIQLELFPEGHQKIVNRFIFSSRPERGLRKLLDLWPEIKEKFFGAQLFICSYCDFPNPDSVEELDMKVVIDQEDTIHHLGKLSQKELHQLIITVEYWFFTSIIRETSCITAMEMLAAGVICLYYPVGGLVDTMGDYGVPMEEGKEVETLLKLSVDVKEKNRLISRVKEYANTCSWEKRAEKWMELIDTQSSNNILIFTGMLVQNPWNYTYLQSNAVGESETAVMRLAKSFPKHWKIYIAGTVIPEVYENIHFIDYHNIENLLKNTLFHTIIVSRFIYFYKFYNYYNAHQTFIWVQDTVIMNQMMETENLNEFLKNIKNLKGYICQTPWHANIFKQLYPCLQNKIYTINNGIKLDLFTEKPKVKNRFLYSSCVERGLKRLLELWPDIKSKLPDATLLICNYNEFPRPIQDEIEMKAIIDQDETIQHLGRLSQKELCEFMCSTEYWLYPSKFQETSCITAMEMLAAGVICLYYPVGGLVDTIGDYGVPMEEGKEVETLLKLSIEEKNRLISRGKEYAKTCSWEKRSEKWMELIQ
jgi:glycosyltransferase involved in cell wall biosynthesis